MKAASFAVLVGLIAATATRAADEDASVADTLVASKEHTALLTALKEAGLFAALDGRELNGFKVSAKDGLKIGDAKVTKRDVRCGNGVVHVIDAVLVPAK